MMRMELRLAMECSACEQLNDVRSELPPGGRPHDPLTGRVDIRACLAMGFCPACFMPLWLTKAPPADYLSRLFERFAPKAARFARVAAKARALGWKGPESRRKT